jgi:hypothetical protein
MGGAALMVLTNRNIDETFVLFLLAFTGADSCSSDKGVATVYEHKYFHLSIRQ